MQYEGNSNLIFRNKSRGFLVKQTRKKMGIKTAKELAEKTGILPRTINSIENGENCTKHDSLMTLANYLHVPIIMDIPIIETTEAFIKDRFEAQKEAIKNLIEERSQKIEGKINYFRRGYQKGVNDNDAIIKSNFDNCCHALMLDFLPDKAKKSMYAYGHDQTIRFMAHVASQLDIEEFENKEDNINIHIELLKSLLSNDPEEPKERLDQHRDETIFKINILKKEFELF